MKYRITKKGNAKLTVNPEELEALARIVGDQDGRDDTRLEVESYDLYDVLDAAAQEMGVR